MAAAVICLRMFMVLAAGVEGPEGADILEKALALGRRKGWIVISALRTAIKREGMLRRMSNTQGGKPEANEYVPADKYQSLE